jgi:hypothetical protein
VDALISRTSKLSCREIEQKKRREGGRMQAHSSWQPQEHRTEPQKERDRHAPRRQRRGGCACARLTPRSLRVTSSLPSSGSLSYMLLSSFVLLFVPSLFVFLFSLLHTILLLALLRLVLALPFSSPPPLGKRQRRKPQNTDAGKRQRRKQTDK